MPIHCIQTVPMSVLKPSPGLTKVELHGNEGLWIFCVLKLLWKGQEKWSDIEFWSYRLSTVCGVPSYLVPTVIVPGFVYFLFWGGGIVVWGTTLLQNRLLGPPSYERGMGSVGQTVSSCLVPWDVPFSICNLSVNSICLFLWLMKIVLCSFPPFF